MIPSGCLLIIFATPMPTRVVVSSPTPSITPALPGTHDQAAASMPTVCAVAPSPNPSSPTQQVAASAMPISSARPLPTPVVLVPSTTTTYAGRDAAPEDPPRIFSVELSNATPAGGEVISGRVITTSNVAAVVARLDGMQAALGKSDVGVFTITYALPRIPFFLRHNYTIEISAITAAGQAVSVGAPIRLR